jgi:hypothetical protein
VQSTVIMLWRVAASRMHQFQIAERLLGPNSPGELRCAEISAHLSLSDACGSEKVNLVACDHVKKATTPPWSSQRGVEQASNVPVDAVKVRFVGVVVIKLVVRKEDNAKRN